MDWLRQRCPDSHPRSTSEASDSLKIAFKAGQLSIIDDLLVAAKKDHGPK